MLVDLLLAVSAVSAAPRPAVAVVSALVARARERLRAPELGEWMRRQPSICTFLGWPAESSGEPACAHLGHRESRRLQMCGRRGLEICTFAPDANDAQQIYTMHAEHEESSRAHARAEPHFFSTKCRFQQNVG